jgi:nicotinamidase-related amidase
MARMRDLTRTALVVVDVQRGFEDAYWTPPPLARNNPACEANVGRLIQAWRAARRPLVFVRHDSIEPGSPLQSGSAGNAFKDVVTGDPDLLVSKTVNSAFYGSPDLHAWLQEREIPAIAVCGITTDHCVETTARMGGNLGYDVLFVLDATHTFDRVGPDGDTVTAPELARATAASLHGEFATVTTTENLVRLTHPRKLG